MHHTARFSHSSVRARFTLLAQTYIDEMLVPHGQLGKTTDHFPYFVPCNQYSVVTLADRLRDVILIKVEHV